ncbi:hypothetical protein FGO68_gene16975 [Halteria grandinella]|uniref:DUF4419 domain-containing protein n=1 Tax=Halteria grandinella TaxID=5974 RepID=A0A8J8NML1_HALGN|nr:hypothetical protein FGO68_gene16975 [Halteria grandinella]
MGNTFKGTTKRQYIEKKADGFIVLTVDKNLEEQWDKLSFQDAKSILSNATKDITVYGSSPLSGKFIQSTIRQSKLNQFAECARIAYQHHIPLELSPSVLWLAIAQGFATHVNENAETLRKKFVKFEGKELLQVLVKESLLECDWQIVIGEFSVQIKEHIGQDAHQTLCPDFSTSTLTEIVATEITLLDAMKNYFQYEVVCLCGISKVKMLGTLSDWQLLRDSTEKLRQYGCDWWIDYLLPILDKLILAYKGEVDKQFWNSIYVFRKGGGSGPPSSATGWIINFFPYINTQKQLHFYDLSDLSQSEKARVPIDKIPCGNSKAPFNFVDGIKMKTTSCFFVSGFFSIEVVDGFLAPHVGWAVIDGQKKE